MKIRDGSTPWLAYNRVFMCSGIKRNVVICEKGKKGRKITKRLQGPVSLLLVLDEKHKRYPRGSAMQQAGVLWHLKGWRIESGNAGEIAKLLNFSMNERSWQIKVGTTFSPNINEAGEILTQWAQCFLKSVLTFIHNIYIYKQIPVMTQAYAQTSIHKSKSHVHIHIHNYRSEFLPKVHRRHSKVYSWKVCSPEKQFGIKRWWRLVITCLKTYFTKVCGEGSCISLSSSWNGEDRSTGEQEQPAG